MSRLMILMDLLERLIPVFKAWAAHTENPMDDIVARIAELVVMDEEIRNLLEKWINGYVVVEKTYSATPLKSDAGLIEVAKAIAGRLNIDWQKVIEILVKVLPLILPIFLNDGEESE